MQGDGWHPTPRTAVVNQKTDRGMDRNQYVPACLFCNPRDARASWEFAYVRTGKRRTSLECCRVAAKFNRITDCSASLSRLRLPPTSAASCSHPATASLPAPGSHPSPRTSLSRHRSCASTRPLPAPHLPSCARSPTASALRSSAPLCDCFSTYSLPLSFAQIILSFVRKEGI